MLATISLEHDSLVLMASAGYTYPVVATGCAGTELVGDFSQPMLVTWDRSAQRAAGVCAGAGLAAVHNLRASYL